MKQALRRGEEEEGKLIALERKFFVPPITTLIVVQPCEKDHAGHLVDPEEAKDLSEPANNATNQLGNDLDNAGSVKTQDDVGGNAESSQSLNNNWDHERSTTNKPSGWDYSRSSNNHKQNHNNNHNNHNNHNHHNHNNNHNKNNHNLNRWDYPDYPTNDVPCKLVLYKYNLGKGQQKAFWKSERVLGDFEDWAWSGQAEGSCCWRLFDKPNFSGARVDLYPGKLYR